MSSAYQSFMCKDLCPANISLPSLRRQYTDDGLEPIEPVLREGERLHVPVCHDESVISCNELRNRAWLKDGEQPLRKKGKGRSIHVSDFIVEQTGRLCLSPEQIADQEKLKPEDRLPFYDARQVIYPGKNHDGFWNNEKLIPQVRHCHPAWPFFDHAHNILWHRLFKGRSRPFNISTLGRLLSSSLTSHRRTVLSRTMPSMQRR